MKHKKLAPIVRYIVPPLIKLWIKKINGLEHVPKSGPIILAANHSSYIEHMMFAAILVPLLDKKIHFIAKKEHFESMTQSSWHALWSRYIGYIPIDRSKGEEALEAAKAYLEKNAIVIIYPEGTRTLTGRIQKGKTGVARLALWSKAPVVPVGIKGTFEIMPKGKHIPRCKRATFMFGKPMYFEKYYKKEQTKEMLREITDVIMKEIARLAGQHYQF